jgi:hypothetical protein
MLALAAGILMCGCSASGAQTSDRVPQPLSRFSAEQLMLRADDIKRAAFASPGTAKLEEAFRGRALKLLNDQARSMTLRSLRLEEQASTRSLVFWDPGPGEAVLQVAAERRLLTPDQPDPAWAATVRQWWGRLQYADGSWWVVDQEELPPDRWLVM